jgi:hypothetical protein
VAAALPFGKTKTPPPVWQWGSIKLINESEPNRRAAQQQQRVQQQVQIQIAIHCKNHSHLGSAGQILFLPVKMLLFSVP